MDTLNGLADNAFWNEASGNSGMGRFYEAVSRSSANMRPIDKNMVAEKE